MKKEVVIMERIRIKDLPQDMAIRKEEFLMIRGGLGPQPEPPDLPTGATYIVGDCGMSSKLKAPTGATYVIGDCGIISRLKVPTGATYVIGDCGWCSE